MTLLEIGTTALFNDFAGRGSVLLGALKFIGASMLISFLAIMLFIGIVMRSVFRGMRHTPKHGLVSFVRSTALLIGVSIAAVLMFGASLFGVGGWKLLFIGLLIAFSIQWLIRKAVQFFIARKFGRAVFIVRGAERFRDRIFRV